MQVSGLYKHPGPFYVKVTTEILTGSNLGTFQYHVQHD